MGDNRRVKRRCVEEECAYKEDGVLEGRVNKTVVVPAMSPNVDMRETILKTTFGCFVGVEENGVRRFVGIKYAQVKNWLATPELITSYGNEVIDATRYG